MYSDICKTTKHETGHLLQGLSVQYKFEPQIIKLSLTVKNIIINIFVDEIFF